MAIDRRAIYDRDRGFCGICGLVVPFQQMHLDHVIPEKLGGKTEPDNLRVAHARCNIRRGAEQRTEYRQAGISRSAWLPPRWVEDAATGERVEVAGHLLFRESTWALVCAISEHLDLDVALVGRRAIRELAASLGIPDAGESRPRGGGLGEG